MLTAEQLKQVVHQDGVTKTDAALLCVAAGGGGAVGTAAVRNLAIEAGVKGAKKINFSAHLSSAEDKVFKTPKGWELSDAGRADVASLAASILSVAPAAKEAKALRVLLPKLKSDDAREFLKEAIVCAESNLCRAAVVLSWVGAVKLLHDEAVAKHLAAVNAAALKRKPNDWKNAKNADGLGRLTESEFLQVAHDVGMIDKNVKQKLEECLKLRNSCGHPTTLKLGPNMVAAHLESLALNVYAVFS